MAQLQEELAAAAKEREREKNLAEQRARDEHGMLAEAAASRKELAVHVARLEDEVLVIR